MARGGRSYNPRLVSQHKSYTVQDVSELYGVHKNTVLRWFKNGLKKVDSSKPFLIHGLDLIDFLQQQSSARKQKCKLNEFYCLSCRAPRCAIEESVKVQFINDKKMNLKAKCISCEGKVRRVGLIQKLFEYQKIYPSLKQVSEHIVES